MGTKFLFRLTALAVAMAMVVLGAGVAFADDVSNNLDSTVDATVETMALTAGGATGSTTFRIVATADDGKNGCNFGGTSGTLVVDVVSSLPAKATVVATSPADATRPQRMTFDSCGDTHAITVTPLSEGSPEVSLREVSNTTGASFNLAPATFQVNVAAAAPTCVAASISTHPSPATVTYGNDATFTAAAGGSPTPTLQWQSNASGNWVDLPGQTGTTLTVTTPAVSQSGTQYRAVATNTCSGTKTANSNPATLTVNQRALTVTADAKTKTYGDSDPSFTYQVAGTLVGSDAFTGSLERATGSDVGSYAIRQGTLSAGPNYDVTFQTANLTITQRPITVSPDTKSKSYAAADPALTYAVTAGSLAAGDSLSGQLTRDPGESVGSYAIRQGSVSAGSNYNITYRGANLSIERLVLRVNAANDSKVYGDSNPTPQWSLSGFATGEDATSAGVAGTPSCSVTTGSANVGTYTEAITCDPGTLAADNYSFQAGNKGNLTITAKPITVTADPQSNAYGSADPTLTYTAPSGALESGDSFSGSLTRESGTNVGTYAIQQGTLTAGDNYNISFTGANLTITAKPITVTADNKSKVWGEQDPALTYSVSQNGLLSGDSFTGGLARQTGTTVGSYAINQDTLTAGNNYDITFVGATFTITPAFRFSGLYSPVDAQPTLNTVKGGSTVPLKFEVFAGTVEQKDVTVVNPLLTKKKTCGTNASDSIEVTATGGTALRFDAASDQFVYNWQTPKTPGACYTVTVELADGSQVSADFQMK